MKLILTLTVILCYHQASLFVSVYIFHNYLIYFIFLLKVSSEGAFRESMDACMREMNINRNEFDPKNPTKEQMCLYKCVADKNGLLDINGNPKPDVLGGRMLTSEEMEKYKECFEINSEDKCELIFKRGRCAIDKGFDPMKAS